MPQNRKIFKIPLDAYIKVLYCGFISNQAEDEERKFMKNQPAFPCKYLKHKHRMATAVLLTKPFNGEMFETVKIDGKHYLTPTLEYQIYRERMNEFLSSAVLLHKAKQPDPFDDFCYQCDQGE